MRSNASPHRAAKPRKPHCSPKPRRISTGLNSADFRPHVSGGEARGLAFVRRQHDLLQLEEYPQRESKPDRLGLAAERQLADAALDMPFGVSAVLEENDVA